MFCGDDVSVIIPTHNRPNRLIRAAKSVDTQSVSPNELIIVNDGSDRSYSDAQRTLDELSISTRYIETDGVGAPAARNLGAEFSNGDVLMFLDDDDSWRTKKVEGQLKRFEKDVGLVYSGRIVVDRSGNELYQIDGGEVGNLSTEILIRNLIGTTSSPAIRADVFENVDGFDKDMPGLQDWDLWIRVLQETLVEYDPTYTVEWTYHQNGNQMTSQADRYLKAVNLLREKHSKLYNELSWIGRRKSNSNYNKAIAKKYSQNNSNKKYQYIFRSLLQWPSVAAAARLLPNSVLTKLRSVF